MAMLSTRQKPPMISDVVTELIKEQNELQDMMIDVMKAISETHPEIVLKYQGYAEKVKKGRK